MTDQPTGDFDGCNSECRKAGKHSLRWGGCEHATPPEPTVSMSVVYTDPTDGYPAIGFDRYTVPQLAELIVPSLVSGDAGCPIPFDVLAARGIALRVAHAIVHRHDGPVPAVPVSSPPPDQTADRSAVLREASRKFPLPARAALITYAATTRTVTADGLTPLLDAHEAEARTTLLQQLIREAEEFDGHITVQELRRMAAAARQPEAVVVPQNPYPDCERCGDTGADSEYVGEPCVDCQGADEGSGAEQPPGLPAVGARQPDTETDGAGEPPEIRDLPREVRRLVHAVDRMRSDWAEAPEHGPERRELWTEVHAACDAVWDRVHQWDAETDQPRGADTQPVRHAPGIAILCSDCLAKGRAVCMDDERPRCPHCQMPHDLTPGMARVCASILASIADRDAVEGSAAAATREETRPVRIKHSGPHTRFCVLCLSGEHERVDEEA